jgi:DNA-binding transcriptional MerR regulator
VSTAARGGKSQAAFRTISEVADELDVAQHVLRFWESKFPQVRPLKRGGGRRYYRPEDIDLLRDIRSLLYDEGYTIKGAQKLLRQRRAKPQAPAKPAEATPETSSVQSDLQGITPDPPAPAAASAARSAEAAPPPSGQPAPPPVADNPGPAAQPLPSMAPTAAPTAAPSEADVPSHPPSQVPPADLDKLKRLRSELLDLREAVDAALASAGR